MVVFLDPVYKYEARIEIMSKKGLKGEYSVNRLGDYNNIGRIINEYEMYLKGIKGKKLVQKIFRSLCCLYGFYFYEE